MTDRVELAEQRTEADDLHVPLVVRIAGMNKHPGAVHIRAGNTLALIREPTNPHDEKATMLVAAGEKAGYVPRQYSALVAKLLDAGVPLEATAVRQLGEPADAGRWVVRLARR